MERSEMKCSIRNMSRMGVETCERLCVIRCCMVGWYDDNIKTVKIVFIVYCAKYKLYINLYYNAVNKVVLQELLRP